MLNQSLTFKVMRRKNVCTFDDNVYLSISKNYKNFSTDRHKDKTLIVTTTQEYKQVH